MAEGSRSVSCENGRIGGFIFEPKDAKDGYRLGLTKTEQRDHATTYSSYLGFEVVVCQGQQKLGTGEAICTVIGKYGRFANRDFFAYSDHW